MVKARWPRQNATVSRYSTLRARYDSDNDVKYALNAQRCRVPLDQLR